MKIKRNEIKFIKDILNRLTIEFNLDPHLENIEYNDGEVFLSFPEEEEISIPIEYFFELFSEIDSITIHNDNKVTTSTITQRAIEISPVSPVVYMGFLESYINNGIRIRILNEPILIGLAATKLNHYDKYAPPCSRHFAVELTYPSKESRLTEQEEDDIIKSYFFELSHQYKMSFEYSSYHYIDDFDFTEYTDGPGYMPKELEKYNQGMDLFIKASQPISDDLKYLTYYKILEFFAPIYSKIDAFESMRRKLDSSNASNPNGKFIASIFDLAKKYSDNLRDKELIKPLINGGFDFVDIYEYLPESIKKKIKKEAGTENLDYDSKPETIDKAVNLIGQILYSTRNQIVHAKSNYTSNGFECPESDLKILNEFMHKATYSVIKWYNRLPGYLKTQ